jgi:pre-rRNA-processing protein TSR3
LILIDCNWARVGRLLPVFADRGPLARRSIPAEVQTAYPRRSKVFEDPAGGLATIEAIVAALAILGWPEPSLLDGFHWAGEFLERNRFLFGGLESSAVRAGRLAGGEGASPV